MFRRLFNDIKKYFHYSVVSAKSQLKAEVANSYLNWIWWVLDPLCFMLIYTFIFGYVFNSSEKYFPVFIFIGLSMWDFFNRTITNSVKIVKNNKAIVSKVYLPKYILILIKPVRLPVTLYFLCPFCLCWGCLLLDAGRFFCITAYMWRILPTWSPLSCALSFI